MYTLRPMLSWQYFHQASTIYQLYLKMNGRITEDNAVLMQKPLRSPSRNARTARFEQRLYWSCFKSESEFRVELPLPQSEIAAYDFPDLFPSPPSPIANDHGDTAALNHSPGSIVGQESNLSIAHVMSHQEDDNVRIHAKRLCNEEESWYYYLTEVALRRIGNRIINTFFSPERNNWSHIDKLVDVAIEFEAQVSTWMANLPPAMQKYESTSTIRAPRIVSPGGAETGFVSQELSWAIENRLLEMRHWLYQPFLFYLVHARPGPVSPALRRARTYSSTTSSQDDSERPWNTFWPLIVRAIECNMAILETRTLPHRHHGLWFDLRAIISSTLLLLAVVKSGYESLIPGGRQALIGSGTDVDVSQPQALPRLQNLIHGPVQIRGRFGRVLRQLEIWSVESPDMIRAREVLQVLIRQVFANP